MKKSRQDGPALRPALGRQLWKWRWQLLALVLVILAEGYVGVPRLLGPVVKVYPVERQDLVQTVVASGQVQSPNR